MNQYESRYVRGSTFLEEKTMDKECINKFWLTVNEAASKPYPPFSQEIIDEAKKRCHNMLNPNVPPFLPGNVKESSTLVKADKLYQQVVEGVHQQKDFLIAQLPRNVAVHIESQDGQEAEDVYQMCLICYTNHLKSYNCQTDMQNSQNQAENVVKHDKKKRNRRNKARMAAAAAKALAEAEAEKVMGENTESSEIERCYNPYSQSYFEDYDSGVNTGYSSSDEEKFTPTESDQWLGQDVTQMDHQVTEGLYNPYQNQVDNVWFDNYYLSTQ